MHVLQQRRIIVERPLMYPKRPNPKFKQTRLVNPGKAPMYDWRPIEKKVSGQVVVEVNELPMPVPKYSFKLGSVKVDEGGQIISVSPHLNLYNVFDAANLLREVGEKYASIREERQREFDARGNNREDSDLPDDEDPRERSIQVTTRRNIR